MLINLSNHPSDNWESKQKEKAISSFGSIIDLSFPPIDPQWTKLEISIKAKEYFNKCMLIFDQCANEPKANAVHIQGEFTFVFRLVIMLKQSDIKCLASTTLRNAEELDDGKKIVKFQFIQFREY